MIHMSSYTLSVYVYCNVNSFLVMCIHIKCYAPTSGHRFIKNYFLLLQLIPNKSNMRIKNLKQEMSELKKRFVIIDHIRLQYLRFITLRAYRMDDWRKIPIKENGEKLVQVPDEIAFPFYARTMNFVESEQIYLREEVLEKVLNARERLKSFGFDLKVYDGWRSVELQEKLFWFYMRAFTAGKFNQKEQFEQLDDFSTIKACFESLPPETQMVMREANRTFVSWPSKDPEAPSPHATGGSVDVWLFENGKAANLGVPFDWMEENAGAFYHLKLRKNKFTGNDRKICRNRSKIILAMANAGFSCYGPEFWHFNYGNQMDALVKGGTACYSYIEP